MRTVIVRYRPGPEHLDENRRLVEDVHRELSDTRPDGFEYRTWELADGTFVHLARFASEDDPLARSPAFQRFVAGVADRCPPADRPQAHPATPVGAYGGV